jgi:GAF domain-containing protein
MTLDVSAGSAVTPHDVHIGARPASPASSWVTVPSSRPEYVIIGVMATSGSLDEDALLRRLSGELARLHSWDDVAGYVIGAAVQLLGGNTGSLCLLTTDGRELEIVAEHGYALDVTAVWTRFRVDAPLPASEAVRTAKAVFITSPEDRDTRYPIFTEQPVVQDAAYAIEPLVVDGRTLGALVIGFEEPRQFSSEDQALLAAAAGRCAQALDKRRRT